MPNYWHQVTSETFGVQQFKLAIGKVDGIEIELAIFCGRTRKLVKNWIHLLFRQLLGNENRYCDGEKVGIYIYKKTPFGQNRQFSPCYGCLKSAEGDKIQSVGKTMRCTKKHVSHNFQNWAFKLTSLLPIVGWYRYFCLEMAAFSCFFGLNKFSWPNDRLSPIACHTYLESYDT